MLATAEPTTTPRFLARQPIFDRTRKVFGYELLARTGATNSYQHADPDAATRQAVDFALHLIGLDELTDRKLAFVNLTRGLLLEDFARVLPARGTVLEILETVEPTEEILTACRRLRRQGYRLALDDFAASPEYEPLVQLADFVKIDFMATSPVRRRLLAQRFANTRAQLIAEKVETRRDFDEAARLGYAYFQGYFFCKPQLLERSELPVEQQAYLRFLREVARPVLDYDRLDRVVRGEVGLSVRLLSYLNSAGMGLHQRVTSIRHALALLGERPLRRWASAFAVRALSGGRPLELARASLVRARSAELLVEGTPLADRAFDAFLVGLLASLDVMLGVTMAQALQPLPIADDLKAALDGSDGPLRGVLDVVLAYERGDWAAVESACERHGLSAPRLAKVYVESIRFADRLLTT